MQKLTKTEIRWIISALQHKKVIVNIAISQGVDKTHRELANLELENLDVMINKLEKTLEENDKRICIEQ